MKILVMGGVTYDDLVYVEKFPAARPHTLFSKKHHATVGGTGAGKALNLNRLGHDVTLHALIGDDPQGAFIREYFAREGLCFKPVIDPKGTERHINLMNDDGERISIYVNYATFEPEVNFEGLFENVDHIVLNIINYCRYAIPLINKPIWVDIHDYDGESTYHQDFIDAADYLFMSSDQMPDYRAFMQRMIDDGKQLAICTHGKKGASILSKEGWIETPIIPVEVVDTNGAGDSFFSGFLHGYLQGLPLETCMQYGTITAGLCVGSSELFSDKLTAESLHR